MTKTKIGIIIADMDEYAAMTEKIRELHGMPIPTRFRAAHSFQFGKGSVLTLCCGIGKVNAATAATWLVENGCNQLLNFGYSGGVSGVARGQIVLATRFLEHDFDLTPLGYAPCEKPGQTYIYDADKGIVSQFTVLFPWIKGGTAVCGDRFICDNTVCERIFADFGAMSCDMETAAIASVCHLYGVPFAAVRQISDDAGDDAKENYRALLAMQKATMVDMVFAVAEKILSEDTL